MRKRYKESSYKRRKTFGKTANRMHGKNRVKAVMRGGTRL